MSEQLPMGTEFIPPKPDKAADKVAQLRKEFEEALHGIDREGGFQLAMPLLYKYQAAVPFFELGVKLGQEDPKIVQELIDEIKGKLAAGEQSVGQQIRPNQYPRGKK
ncbi:MAG: hypothetical protein NTY31_01660 [Candidatus Falkowbacteria bacterium]|nr:hypothetical protein [Candidatus Falkowbacteria bacterium]